jgi:hypothetical protein
VLILVDYDNIPEIERSRGALNVVDRVINRLDEKGMIPSTRVDFKFYGGWYLDKSLTFAAQRLVAELSSKFPHPYKLNGSPHSSIIVSAQLAHSLEIHPKQELHSTFRLRAAPLKKFRCRTPAEVGCLKPLTCPMAAMQSLFDTGICPAPGCSHAMDDFFPKRGEQKLVDSMMVADLIYAAMRKDDAIAVVSSDDDLWPGIISAMILGSHVLHVETKQSGRHTLYGAGVPGKYSALRFIV